MGIRIRRLDDGYLVTDDGGLIVWEAAAVTLADAEALARNRVHPRAPSAPPRCMPTSGYAEDAMPPALDAGPPVDSPEFPPVRCLACED